MQLSKSKRNTGSGLLLVVCALGLASIVAGFSVDSFKFVYLGALALVGALAWFSASSGHRAGLVVSACLGLLVGVFAVMRGYEQDRAIYFFGGLFLISGIVAAVGYAPRRKRAAFIMVGNLLLLLSVGLAGLEGVARVKKHSKAWTKERLLTSDKKPYFFGNYANDSTVFRDWWEDYTHEWYSIKNTIEMPDPKGEVPYLFRPGSSVKFFYATVRINSLGFRGPEFPLEKGKEYRILTMGESTTWGATIYETDRPWPEVLGELINIKLSCDRPVRVINGGMEAHNVSTGVALLKRDLLDRAKPDMAISYYGANGFSFFKGGLPPIAVAASETPQYVVRPSKLLANIEFMLKVNAFRRRYADVKPLDFEEVRGSVMESKYAGYYREWISILKKAGVRPVLSTFNMAVTKDSPDEVVKYYEQGFPSVKYYIVANRLHNEMAKKLADESGVPFVDNTNDMNGVYADKFIDLVHLTQKGRDQIAANYFEKLLPILEAEPALRCKPRKSHLAN